MTRGRTSPDTTEDEHIVRIDKWLWAARFYKTRSLASQAIDAGHVRINSLRCKAGRAVQIGDRIALARAGEELEVDVLGLSQLRGPAPVAQCLYEETQASRAKRLEMAALRKLEASTTGNGGRPTKRDRRELERWKGHRG